MFLYVNGCSWSSSSSPTMTTKVYADFLAERLNCQFINHSIPASSNNRIIRSSLRNLNSLKKIHDEIICVINITQPFRSEIWMNDDQSLEVVKKSSLTDFDHKILEKYRLSDDGKFKSFIYGDELLPIRVLRQFNNFEKYNLYFLDAEKAYYQLFLDLLAFVSFCKNFNIRYLVFSGSKLIDYDLVDKSSSFMKDLYEDLKNDQGILNFEDINFCQWTITNGYGFFEKESEIENFTVGHPDVKAHNAWADFLYNKLKAVYSL